MTPSSPDGALTGRIDALLPQTQCGQCGYAGCHPYAQAIADGTTDINRCPPGGDAVIGDLAHLLGRAVKPLDISCGVTKAPAVALIDESWCIGCTLCIQACPVDAIVGAAKVMHTVLAGECTGCELCIPPCPVDCISMIAVERPDDRPARLARAHRARSRYRARQARLAAARAKSKAVQQATARDDDAGARKQATIQRVLAIARNRVKKII